MFSGQLVETEHTMLIASRYLSVPYYDDLIDYDLRGLDDILYVLSSKYSDNMTQVRDRFVCDSNPSSSSLSSQQQENSSRLRRDTPFTLEAEEDISAEKDDFLNILSQNGFDDNNTSENSSLITGKLTKYSTDTRSRRDTAQGDDSDKKHGGIFTLRKLYPTSSVKNAALNNNSNSTTQRKVVPSSGSHVKYTYAEKLLKIAHILHYCSIAILGLFVFQVNLYSWEILITLI